MDAGGTPFPMPSPTPAPSPSPYCYAKERGDMVISPVSALCSDGVDIELHELL